jgi:multidrug efflux pump
VQGGIKPAVRIQADLARLAAYGISLEDLRHAIVGANVSGAEGLARRRAAVLHHRRQRPDRGAEAYKPIIIAYRNGAPVMLGDVADIVDGLENDQGRRLVPGHAGRRSSTSSASPAPTSSRRSSASSAKCPSCSARSRPASTLTVVSDRTDTIRASVRDVQFTLVLSVVLVVLVVLHVPAHHPRHHHRRRGAAAVADRDLRRHVFFAASASTTCR